MTQRLTEKSARYAQISKEIDAVVGTEPDVTARMASIACLLSDAFDQYFWTGFYRVDPARPEELVVGPYQGSLGCLRIPFGKGVCGVAAATGETQVVPDVHAFPGHIACDARSRSEIVVPVRDPDGALIGVLDVDSTEMGAFDETDRIALETLMYACFAVRR